MTRKGMVLLLLRKNMKRIYREMWADKGNGCHYYHQYFNHYHNI